MIAIGLLWMMMQGQAQRLNDNCVLHENNSTIRCYFPDAVAVTGESPYNGIVGISGAWSVPLDSEPQDVPAIQVGTKLDCDEATGTICIDHQIPVYSCADKRRVLLTSENRERHCVLFDTK